MNAQTKLEPMTVAKLREPFPEHQISKLPKPTKKQTDEVKADFKKGTRCTICGSWHHPDVIHLDYVGHAALTDRLLDTDLEWSWEPLSLNEEGLPAFDRNGGLWIKLTVLGVTRLGYGSAEGKSGGDAVKEIIGDALRNAAMRFGAALDLWHKGDLHLEDDSSESGGGETKQNSAVSSPPPGEGRNGAPPARQKLDGPYTSGTQLKTAVKEFVRSMQGCGDWEEWVAFRDTKDVRELFEQVKRDMPQWWDGGPDMPAEFVPLHRQIKLHEAALGQQIADYAQV